MNRHIKDLFISFIIYLVYVLSFAVLILYDEGLNCIENTILADIFSPLMGVAYVWGHGRVLGTIIALVIIAIVCNAMLFGLIKLLRWVCKKISK